MLKTFPHHFADDSGGIVFGWGLPPRSPASASRRLWLSRYRCTQMHKTGGGDPIRYHHRSHSALLRTRCRFVYRGKFDQAHRTAG